MAFAFPYSLETAASMPLRAVNCGIDHPQEPIERATGYPVWQWIQTLEGEGIYTDCGGARTVRAGDVLFLHPQWPHRYRALRLPWIVHWVAFGGSAVPACIGKAPFATLSGPFALPDPASSDGLIREIFAECRLASASSDIRAGGLLYRLLLSASASPLSVSGKGPLRLVPVIEYIEAHLGEKLVLSALAGFAGLSEQHLCRLFRAHYGQSPLAWLELARMRSARSLLLDRPELRIKEIAAMVGFSDQNLFSRRFRLLEGLTPREFRSIHGY